MRQHEQKSKNETTVEPQKQGGLGRRRCEDGKNYGVVVVAKVLRTRETFMALFMAAGIEAAVANRWIARIGVGDLIRIEEAFKYRVPRVIKLLPRQEWGSEDPWLYKFLQEQKTFDESYREQLENHRFWEELSESINGLDLQQCQREFAKMGLWIRENPRRRPTVVGVRRFVASWFQRSWERERRQMPIAR